MSPGGAFWPSVGVAILFWKSLALWLLGYPPNRCGNYTTADVQADEHVALADERHRGVERVWNDETRSASCPGQQSLERSQDNHFAMTARRSTGTTKWMPVWLAVVSDESLCGIGRFVTLGEAMTTVERGARALLDTLGS